MSWGKLYKLIPQKPELESKQSLASTEFLVWDTQFDLNNPSDYRSATLSQETSIEDTAPSKLSDTPETQSTNQSPRD